MKAWKSGDAYGSSFAAVSQQNNRDSELHFNKYLCSNTAGNDRTT